MEKEKMKFLMIKVLLFVGVSLCGCTQDGGSGESFGIVNTSPENEVEPKFHPYIGPGSLTSVTKYLSHLRNNLRALYIEDEEEDEESSLKITQHWRRHTTGEGEFAKQIAAPQARSLQNIKIMLRRPSVTRGYKPSWYYTNLGLGKKKKSGRRRKRGAN